MVREFLRRIQKSFSAKIILLVISSVIVTSFVVGLATTRSTRGFLTEKMSEKFPSVLNSVQSRVRGWYLFQFRDLERLSQSRVFLENLDRTLTAPASESETSRDELNRYLAYVHEDFPVYEEMTVYSPDLEPVASTAQDPGYLDEVRSFIADGAEAPRFTPSKVFAKEKRVYQWLLVPVMREDVLKAWMVARVDMDEFGRLLRETTLGLGGDLYVLDGQGRFLTQPRVTNERRVTQRAIQVPTRQNGPVVVETRNNWAGRSVFHSKVHLEPQDWWIVYEEDFNEAMAPVLSAQRRTWVAVLLIGAIAILAALRIAKGMLKPIHDLAVGARRINEGLVGVNIPRGKDDEIGMMIDTFNEMAKRITLSQAELQYKNKIMNQKNDELEDMNKKLEELSVTDGLTGLFNHRHFWNLLNTELTRVDLYQGDLALILVDLDDFKRVNDQFGHAVGDLLLQSVARLLAESVRDTDIVARYGGEEFTILMPDTNLAARGAGDVAEKIRRAVETLRFKVPETDITLRVTVSIGVSIYRGNRRDFFNDADRALYRSKADGKNRIHVFSERT